MRTTSYSELRRTLAATLDSVTQDHAPVLITRERGKPAAVLMSLEDFASYEETRHLLSSPANAARLRDGIEEFATGGGTEHELLD
jgi:antitoxin YefM